MVVPVTSYYKRTGATAQLPMLHTSIQLRYIGPKLIYELPTDTVIPHSKQSPAAWNINPFNLDLYLPTFYISQPEKHVLPDFSIVPNTAALIR